MSRLLALLLALAVAAGCGKKKPADPPPAPPTGTPVVPEPPKPAPEPPAPIDTAALFKLLKVSGVEGQEKAAAALAAASERHPDVIPGLVEALGDKSGKPAGKVKSSLTASVREAAIVALMLSGQAGEKEAVAKGLPILIAALSDPKEDVREHAAAALGRMGAKAAPAVEKLWEAAADKSAFVREAAIRAVLDIGTDKTQPLCKLLTHENPEVRVTAAEQLRTPNFTRLPVAAVGDLADALADKNPLVRMAAADALARIGGKAGEAAPALLKALAANSPSDKIELDEFAVSVINALVAMGDASVGEVAMLLIDANPVAKFHGAFILGEMGPVAGSAVEKLDTLQSDRVALVAAEAARALVRITESTEKSAEFVKLQLRPNSDSRFITLLAMARMGPAGKGFAPQVLPLLDDKEPSVRAAALDFVATLDATSAKPAVEKVGKLLTAEDERTRNAAAGVLLALGPASAPSAEALAKAVATDAEESVRRTCLDALAAIGPAGKAAAPEIAKVIADANGSVIIRAKAIAVAPLLAPGDSALANAVSKALSDKSKSVQEAAVLAIGKFTDAPADVVKKLGDMVADPKVDFAGRNRALRAIAALGPMAASLKDKLTAASASEMLEYAFWAKVALARVLNKPVEVEVLVRDGLVSKWPAERFATLGVLTDILPPRGADVPHLIVVSKDRDSATRRAAVDVLAKAAAPEAVTRLGEMLKDPDTDVKLAAAAALERLGKAARGAIKHLREAGNGKDEAARAALKALRAVEK